jgi:hypothetical protein
MTNQLSLIIKLVFVSLVVVGAAVFFQRFGGSGIKINRDRAAVITQIKQLNRLETSVFTIEKVIDAGTQGNAFQNFLFGDKILLIAHGKVVAGVDLAKLDENSITVSGDSISIKLPATEIFNSDLDEAETEVYDRTQGILTKGNKDLESQARQAAEEEIKKAACEGGILTKAAESAKQQLTALLQGLGFTTVEINETAGNCTA